MTVPKFKCEVYIDLIPKTTFSHFLLKDLKGMST